MGCKTKRQAEQALQAVTACVEEDRGLALNPENTRLTTCGQGCDFLGDAVSARTIRMGGESGGTLQEEEQGGNQTQS